MACMGVDFASSMFSLHAVIPYPPHTILFAAHAGITMIFSNVEQHPSNFSGSFMHDLASHGSKHTQLNPANMIQVVACDNILLGAVTSHGGQYHQSLQLSLTVRRSSLLNSVFGSIECKFNCLL